MVNRDLPQGSGGQWTKTWTTGLLKTDCQASPRPHPALGHQTCLPGVSQQRDGSSEQHTFQFTESLKRSAGQNTAEAIRPYMQPPGPGTHGSDPYKANSADISCSVDTAFTKREE